MIRVPDLDDADKLEQWVRDRSDEELIDTWKQDAGNYPIGNFLAIVKELMVRDLI